MTTMFKYLGLILLLLAPATGQAQVRAVYIPEPSKWFTDYGTLSVAPNDPYPPSQ